MLNELDLKIDILVRAAMNSVVRCEYKDVSDKEYTLLTDGYVLNVRKSVDSGETYSVTISKREWPEQYPRISGLFYKDQKRGNPLIEDLFNFVKAKTAVFQRERSVKFLDKAIKSFNGDPETIENPNE